MLRTSIRATSRRSRSKPTSVCISACMLRTKRPATTSSSRQKAICAGDERLAHQRAAAAAGVADLARLRLDRVGRRDARAAKRRQHAGREAADHRHRHGEEQDAPVEAGVEIDDRGAAGEHREQQIASPRGDEQPERAADERQHQRFDQQLTDDAPASGARARCARRSRARARSRARPAGWPRCRR